MNVNGHTIQFSRYGTLLYRLMLHRLRDGSAVCQFGNTGESSYFIHWRNDQLDDSAVCQFVDTINKPADRLLT